MASRLGEVREGVRGGRGEGVWAVTGWKARRKQRRRRELRADKQLRAPRESNSQCDPGEVDLSTEEGGEVGEDGRGEEGRGGEGGEEEEEEEGQGCSVGGRREAGVGNGSETVAMETNTSARHAEVPSNVSHVFVQLDRPVEVQVCGSCAVYAVFLAYLMPFQQAVHYRECCTCCSPAFPCHCRVQCFPLLTTHALHSWILLMLWPTPEILLPDPTM